MPAAGAYPIQSLPDGRVRWSDGSISGSMSTNQGRVSTTKPSLNTFKPAPPKVLGTKTVNTGGGGAPSVNNSPVPAGNQTLNNDINQQVEDFGAIIDRDYEVAMSGLNAQESELQGAAGNAKTQIEAGAQPVRNAIGDAQTQNLQGLATQEQQVQTQSRSALQQARDLFRETQQTNIAQLSGLGLSSSSVNEALAEKLGVETARRIAGVTGSTNEVLQNIGAERTRVQTFYKNKLAEVESNLQTQLAGVQQSLVAGLNQINQARQMAAADKANRRQELLSRAQSAVAQLTAQAQNFQQSLQTWEQQKQSSLQEAQRFTFNPADVSRLGSAINNIQGIAGQGFTPSFSINPKGEITTKISKGKKEEDELENPFLGL